MIKRILLLTLIYISTTIHAQEIVSYPELSSTYEAHTPKSNKKKRTTETSSTALLSLPFFDDFAYNSIYPDQNKWETQSVLVNKSFAIDPPTLGVATFDALNKYGKLYSSANSLSFAADTLLSKPINTITQKTQYKSNLLYIKLSDTEYQLISDSTYYTDPTTGLTIAANKGYWYSPSIQLFFDSELTNPIQDSIYYSTDRQNFSYIEGSYSKTDEVIQYTLTDSLYLSFWVQAGGYGDTPESNDSLIIEYYAPANKSNIVINEIGYTWMEIYNPTESTYDLNNYYLISQPITDIIANETLNDYKIESSNDIMPFGYKVIEIDTLDENVSVFYLIGADSSVVDSFSIISDLSMTINARIPDGSDNIITTLDNTSGKMNPGWERFDDITIEPTSSFSYISIPLNQEKFLTKGFRFRLHNFASLGNDPSHARSEDHWNIDMVWLDAQRTENMQYPKDAYFVDNDLSNTFLDRLYRAIPYPHLFEIDEDITKSDIGVTVINQNDETHKLLFNIKAQNNELSNPRAQMISLQEVDLAPELEFEHEESIESFNLYSFITQNTENRDSASFEIKFFFSDESKSEAIYSDFMWNDTITVNQNFHNYYAYDDGSAEAGYGLRGERNSKVAYLYNTYKEDSLQGVAIYFNHTRYDLDQTKVFSLCIWESNDGIPGDMIYEHPGLENRFHNRPNQFVRYEIDPEYIIDQSKTSLLLNGEFFIGINQPYDINLNIGLDLNTNSLTKIYTNFGAGWNESSIDGGSLMMRPLFGEPLPPDTKVNEENASFNCTIYPIPASNYINVRSENTINKIYICDITGSTIISSIDNTIEISSLHEGFYILKALDEHGKISVNKFAISR